MPEDPPVKIVVDCSIPDRDAIVAYTQDQVEAVLNLRVEGKLTNEEAAEKLVALAELAATTADIPDRITIVELEGDELAEHLDRTAAAEQNAAAAVDVRAVRDDLVGKLAEGKATDAEVQQALAKLLGGTT